MLSYSGPLDLHPQRPVKGAFQEVVEVRSRHEALYFGSQTSSRFNLYRAFLPVRPGSNLLIQRLASGRLPVRLVAVTIAALLERRRPDTNRKRLSEPSGYVALS